MGDGPDDESADGRTTTGNPYPRAAFSGLAGLHLGAVVQPGRIPSLHDGGRGFKSLLLHYRHPFNPGVPIIRMEDDSTSINVPVKFRTHELQQAHDFIPRAAELVGNVDTERAQETADELERIYIEYVDGVEPTYPKGPKFAAYLSMPADDWREVVSALGRLHGEEGERVRWFQKKLIDRLQSRLEEME